jgi:predicted transposase YdaD
VNQFDIALKSLLQRQLQSGFLATLTGFRIAEWLGTELPEVRTRHVDLLGRTDSGDLVHIEFQSRNDPRMALRMAEYALAIYRRHRIFPTQVVIYVGERPLGMPTSLTGSGWAYQCRIVDIRTLPTEQFLASPHLEDNVLAVLTRLADSRATIRQILERVSTAPPDQRTAAIGELLLLAGLRQLRVIMKKELERMSVLIDINRHTIFGPMYREAIQQGALEAERRLALRLLTKRFGKLPSASARRIRSMDSAELETLTLRLLDAGSLSDILA